MDYCFHASIIKKNYFSIILLTTEKAASQMIKCVDILHSQSCANGESMITEVKHACIFLFYNKNILFDFPIIDQFSKLFFSIIWFFFKNRPVCHLIFTLKLVKLH